MNEIYLSELKDRVTWFKDFQTDETCIFFEGKRVTDPTVLYDVRGAAPIVLAVDEGLVEKAGFIDIVDLRDKSDINTASWWGNMTGGRISINGLRVIKPTILVNLSGRPVVFDEADFRNGIAVSGNVISGSYNKPMLVRAVVDAASKRLQAEAEASKRMRRLEREANYKRGLIEIAELSEAKAELAKAVRERDAFAEQLSQHEHTIREYVSGRMVTIPKADAEAGLRRRIVTLERKEQAAHESRIADENKRRRDNQRLWESIEAIKNDISELKRTRIDKDVYERNHNRLSEDLKRYQRAYNLDGSQLWDLINVLRNEIADLKEPSKLDELPDTVYDHVGAFKRGYKSGVVRTPSPSGQVPSIIWIWLAFLTVLNILGLLGWV